MFPVVLLFHSYSTLCCYFIAFSTKKLIAVRSSPLISTFVNDGTHTMSHSSFRYDLATAIDFTAWLVAPAPTA
jgi:hypothetical protein